MARKATVPIEMNPTEPVGITAEDLDALAALIPDSKPKLMVRLRYGEDMWATIFEPFHVKLNEMRERLKK